MEHNLIEESSDGDLSGISNYFVEINLVVETKTNICCIVVWNISCIIYAKSVKWILELYVQMLMKVVCPNQIEVSCLIARY